MVSEALAKLLARETELVASAPYGGGRVGLWDTSEWACELRCVRAEIERQLLVDRDAEIVDLRDTIRLLLGDRWGRTWTNVSDSEVDGWVVAIRRIKAENGGEWR